MTTIVRGDVSQKLDDLLSSATLIILLKKDAATMAAMKEELSTDYVQPQRPLGMGSTLVKIASNYPLLMPHGSRGAVVEPSRFSVERKGGCDLIQWALQIAIEYNKSMPARTVMMELTPSGRSSVIVSVRPSRLTPRCIC
jgi:hypothetical protein